MQAVIKMFVGLPAYCNPSTITYVILFEYEIRNTLATDPQLAYGPGESKESKECFINYIDACVDLVNIKPTVSPNSN